MKPILQAALNSCERYQLSFWDASIIEAASSEVATDEA